MGKIIVEGFNVFIVSFNVYGYAGRCVGHFSFNSMAFCHLVYKGSKAYSLNNSVYFQPSCNVVFFHRDKGNLKRFKAKGARYGEKGCGYKV